MPITSHPGTGPKLADLPRIMNAVDAIQAAGAPVDLGAAKSSEVLPIFMEGLMHPEEQLADNIAACTLGRLGLDAAPAGPALRAALFDRQPPYKSALDALDRIGESSTPILAYALTYPVTYPDRSFRHGAANLLGRKGKATTAVVQALQAALADEDNAVRSAATKALKQITESRKSNDTLSEPPGLSRRNKPPGQARRLARQWLSSCGTQ
jgi:HEAT repeats